MSSQRSLRQTYGGYWHVPLLLFIATALLTVGLALPVLHVEKMIFWKDEYSIWAGVVGMAKDGHYGLAALIFFFSVIFPYAKLVSLTVLWFKPLTAESRGRAIRWLKILGKWSMLDVFVVAIIVVMAKSGGLVAASPKAGIYVFAVAIGVSMMVTIYIDRLARKADQGEASK